MISSCQGYLITFQLRYVDSIGIIYTICHVGNRLAARIDARSRYGRAIGNHQTGCTEGYGVADLDTIQASKVLRQTNFQCIVAVFYNADVIVFCKFFSSTGNVKGTTALRINYCSCIVTGKVQAYFTVFSGNVIGSCQVFNSPGFFVVTFNS